MKEVNTNKEVKPIAFTTQVPRLLSCEGVAYNGYVAIPPSHPLHGKDYYDDCVRNLDAHGGITWARCATQENGRGERVRTGMVEEGKPVEGRMEDIGDDWWVLGFDTMHLGDHPVIWNREAVIKETLRLLEQVNNLKEDKDDEVAGA